MFCLLNMNFKYAFSFFVDSPKLLDPPRVRRWQYRPLEYKSVWRRLKSHLIVVLSVFGNFRARVYILSQERIFIFRFIFQWNLFCGELFAEITYVSIPGNNFIIFTRDAAPSVDKFTRRLNVKISKIDRARQLYLLIRLFLNVYLY